MHKPTANPMQPLAMRMVTKDSVMDEVPSKMKAKV